MIDAAHVAAAVQMLDGGASHTDAVEKVRELRGYYAVKDPEAQSKRDASRRSLIRAIGEHRERAAPRA